MEEQEIIYFTHKEKIEKELNKLEEIFSEIKIEEKELSFENIKEIRNQQELLGKIENIGHMILNCSGISIKKSSDKTDDLIMRNIIY